MASRKSHHYIPQFYLRNFSISAERKEIGLDNYRNNLFINKASIKNHACEKWLYGDDQIEAAFSRLEHVAAIVLKIMLELGAPPPENTPHFKILKEFILYQLTRTVKAQRQTTKSFSASVMEVFKLTSHYKDEYKDIEFNVDQPMLLSLYASAQAMPLFEYLSCKIIVNGTNVPFVTSDHPAIKYNQFLESKNLTRGTTGLATKGLQIFFPLNPFLMLVFYDANVYKLKARRDTTLLTTDTRDIWQLNALQYIHSESQLFFGPGVSKDYLEGLVTNFEKIKMGSGPTSQTMEVSGSTNENRDYHVFNTVNVPQIKLDLSFITLTKKAKQFKLDNRLVYLRHPSLGKIVGT